MKALALFLLLATAAPLARADEAARGLFAGLGVVGENLLGLSHRSDGARAPFGTLYVPELLVGYRVGSWFPLLGYTVLGRRSDDVGARRSLLRLQGSYVFSFADLPLEAKAGAGWLWHIVSGGDGRGREVGNGTGTSTFFAPSKTIISENVYLTGGAAWTHGPWRVDLDLLFTGPLTRRRALTLALGGGYVF